MRLFNSKHFLIRFAVFEIERFLENIFQKKLNISKTANRIKKSDLNKKDAKFNYASLLFTSFFDPIRRFRDRAFFGKYFQKKA